MQVIRVAYGNTTFYGSIDKGNVICLDRSKGINEPIPLSSLTVLSPVMPTKIICVAVNYRAHAEEVGREIPVEPILFLKPPSAIIKNKDDIILPSMSARVDYEGELALIIGKQGRRISLDDAPSHVFGYSCGNDVTARDLQKRDGLFARAKGFDTFAPVGPWIETQVENPSDLQVMTYVNGEKRQDGHTSDMIFAPLDILSYVSSVMTLMPGDVILTGTPSGIGPLQPGDEVVVDIPGVGALTNMVKAEENDLADTDGSIH